VYAVIDVKVNERLEPYICHITIVYYTKPSPVIVYYRVNFIFVTKVLSN